MGVVSDYLRDLITRQVNERGLVIWFDAEKHYREFAETLAIPNSTVARYEGSYFALRHQIEPLLDGEAPPRLVVYVPLAEADTHNALIELICAGVVLKPGEVRPRNTRLSVVAKGALREALATESLVAMEKEVEAGKLSLADLDRGGTPGVLALLFGKSEPAHIALALLDSTRYDAEIGAKRTGAEVTQALGEAFGVELPASDAPDDWRPLLARHLLCTEFLASLHGTPPQLASVRVATDERTRAACVEVVRAWRQRRDLSESYAIHANRIELELGLAYLPFELEQIRNCETFAAIEFALQAVIEGALLVSPAEMVLVLAQQRQSGYWAARLPEAQARWALLLVAGQVLAMAERIEEALKPHDLSAADLLRAYTEGDYPWCALDTAQREMEYRCRRFDLSAQHVALEHLIARARQRYMSVGALLAERFLRTLQEAGFQTPGVRRQRDLFATAVAPAVREGKTAYLLVDAMRFELARELVRGLSAGYEVTLEAIIGTPPGITPIGMAALMPGAEAGAHVVAAGAGKLGLEVGGLLLKDRKSRVEWFKSYPVIAASGERAKIVDAKLDEVLDLRRDLKTKIEQADLLLLTSQEIDELAESDNIGLARAIMDETLSTLLRVTRKLADLRFKTIILTADHGFLFGEELGEDMKLDAPGGQTLDLHRRVWVGRGGSADPPFLRVPLAAWGLSDDPGLELAVPWGFAAFKVQGGARAYFHGGLSPQEMAIPVVMITPTSSATAPAVGEITWTLSLGSKKITTRLCTVQISGQSAGLFEVSGPPPRVRVEVRAGNTVLSAPVAASYGYQEATHDVQLQFAAEDSRKLAPNTIALSITAESLQPKMVVSVYLLDTVTGRELARLEPIEMTIMI